MIPIRCCIRCRQRKEKNEFYRIVQNEDSYAILDEKQNINKRGVYICKDKKCLETYLKMLEKGKGKLQINVNLESFKKLLESLIVGMGE